MKWNSYVRLLEETQGYESTGWSEQGEGGVVRESKMERERALKMAQKMMWSSQGVCAELIGGDWKEEKARLKDKMRKKVKYNKERGWVSQVAIFLARTNASLILCSLSSFLPNNIWSGSQLNFFNPIKIIWDRHLEENKCVFALWDFVSKLCLSKRREEE